jgi:hypothetical protein
LLLELPTFSHLLLLLLLQSVLHVIDAVLVPPVIPKVKPAPAIDTTKPTPKP